MNQISVDLELKNIKTHVVGFEGPQNYGDDEIWAAHILAVQEVYDLLSTIFKDES